MIYAMSREHTACPGDSHVPTKVCTQPLEVAPATTRLPITISVFVSCASSSSLAEYQNDYRRPLAMSWQKGLLGLWVALEGRTSDDVTTIRHHRP